MESKEAESVIVVKLDENDQSIDQNASPEVVIVSPTPVVQNKKNKKPKQPKVEKSWWGKSLKWLNPLDGEESQSDDSSQEEAGPADLSLDKAELLEVDSCAENKHDPPSLESKETVDDTIIQSGKAELVTIAAVPMIVEQRVVELPLDELDEKQAGEVETTVEVAADLDSNKLHNAAE
jgi:hypothetical protein